MLEFLKNFTKPGKNIPRHYASKFYLDKESLPDRKYHSFSSSKEADDDYQKNINKNKINSLLELTSDSLKIEYLEKLYYLNKNLKRVFIISMLIIINCSLYMKFFGHSELNISMIILSSLSISIIFILLFNIKTNVLLDIYGYSSFYLFSIFHSIILTTLLFFELINFILIINRFIERHYCKGKNKYLCAKNYVYFLVISMSLYIFIGIVLQIKYIYISFYEAFNILVLGEKTMLQKQIEINEKGNNDKIEFADENDSMNRSTYHLNSSRGFKTE